MYCIVYNTYVTMLRRFINLPKNLNYQCSVQRFHQNNYVNNPNKQNLRKFYNNTNCKISIRTFSSYKKKFNKLQSDKKKKAVWERDYTDEPNLSGRANRIREEIKKLTPIYEEVTETELENLTIYPKDEEDNEHVYYDKDEVEEEDEEDMAIEEEIMFDHPEFQKHTRKDKTKEHGYITLDKYGTETPFEFPMDDINKDSPWYQHCYKFLVEAKGQNITYYRHLRPEADHILVCTCLSRLHIANIAYGLMDIGKGLRRKHLRMEGQPEDDWVCIDSGDTLVHIFTQGDRDYYGIDLLYTVEHPYIDSSSEATG